LNGTHERLIRVDEEHVRELLEISEKMRTTEKLGLREGCRAAMRALALKHLRSRKKGRE
jgi:hypothetical protein